MRITIIPTDKVQYVDGRACRIWQGVSESGVPVLAWVAVISPQTHDEEARATFTSELAALPAPTFEPVELVFPVAFIAVNDDGGGGS